MRASRYSYPQAASTLPSRPATSAPHLICMQATSADLTSDCKTHFAAFVQHLGGIDHLSMVFELVVFRQMIKQGMTSATKELGFLNQTRSDVTAGTGQQCTIQTFSAKRREKTIPPEGGVQRDNQPSMLHLGDLCFALRGLPCNPISHMGLGLSILLGDQP